MILAQVPLLVIAYFVLLASVIVVELVLLRRSQGVVLKPDRGFISKVIVSIAAGQTIAIVSLKLIPALTFGGAYTSLAGVIMMAIGAAVRWWAIIHLGRYFTLYLRIAPDQRVVSDGPYRYVRHPSYSGLLLFMSGWGLCFGNWLSLAAIVLPFAVITATRIRNEETLLAMQLGEPYRIYMRNTKRLIPKLL